MIIIHGYSCILVAGNLQYLMKSYNIWGEVKKNIYWKIQIWCSSNTRWNMWTLERSTTDIWPLRQKQNFTVFFWYERKMLQFLQKILVVSSLGWNSLLIDIFPTLKVCPNLKFIVLKFYKTKDSKSPFGVSVTLLLLDMTHLYFF